MSDEVIIEADETVESAVAKLNTVLDGMDLQIAVPAVLTVTETALRHIATEHAIGYLRSAADLLEKEKEVKDEE